MIKIAELKSECKPTDSKLFKIHSTKSHSWAYEKNAKLPDDLSAPKFYHIKIFTEFVNMHPSSSTTNSTWHMRIFQIMVLVMRNKKRHTKKRGNSKLEKKSRFFPYHAIIL